MERPKSIASAALYQRIVPAGFVGLSRQKKKKNVIHFLLESLVWKVSTSLSNCSHVEEDSVIRVADEALRGPDEK